MSEDFLHYIWRTKNFAFTDMCTTEGLSVDILDFGIHNHEGGPDFKNCKAMIDGLFWAGNIEMHLLSSDWNKHGHSSDPAYESVVLHVVLEEDIPVFIGDRKIPCLELRGRIHVDILSRYRKLMQLESWVPCAAHLTSVPAFTKELCLERMLVERLETRVGYFQELQNAKGGDWEEVLYISLGRSFGFKANGGPLERLARLIPLKLIRSMRDDPIAIEALFFGMAGMLNKIFIDAYPIELQKRFAHLAHKHNLNPMDRRSWQWGRLRPANFPTIRIAQFARFISATEHLISHLVEAGSLKSLRGMFFVGRSMYWEDHSDFDKPSKRRARSLGTGSVYSILINSVCPFLFIYGKYRGSEQLCERALDYFMEIPAEQHRITRGWTRIGMPNLNAGQSQALIHLKAHYCNHHKCPACSIGNHILTKTEASYG
jgi:uncharacterized protein DUF2851